MRPAQQPYRIPRKHEPPGANFFGIADCTFRIKSPSPPKSKLWIIWALELVAAIPCTIVRTMLLDSRILSSSCFNFSISFSNSSALARDVEFSHSSSTLPNAEDEWRQAERTPSKSVFTAASSWRKTSKSVSFSPDDIIYVMRMFHGNDRELSGWKATRGFSQQKLRENLHATFSCILQARPFWVSTHQSCLSLQLNDVLVLWVSKIYCEDRKCSVGFWTCTAYMMHVFVI